MHQLTPSFEIHSKIPMNFDDDMMMGDNQMFTRIDPIMEETSTEIYSENDPEQMENTIILESGYQQQDDENFIMPDELCDSCQMRLVYSSIHCKLYLSSILIQPFALSLNLLPPQRVIISTNIS